MMKASRVVHRKGKKNMGEKKSTSKLGASHYVVPIYAKLDFPTYDEIENPLN